MSKSVIYARKNGGLDGHHSCFSLHQARSIPQEWNEVDAIWEKDYKVELPSTKS
ncbi:MAG: hypothetical protein JST28_23370 [Acidobacteria bacterium]|nr:hypothetical protein [Acidobacteriota bacterium]